MSDDHLPPGSVKSAVRVFEIIEYLDVCRGGLPLSEIARDLGYPISSTAQLLKCMCDIGVIRKDRSTRRYFTTPKLMMLGAARSAPAWAKGSIYDVMDQLRAQTGETVALGMRIGVSINFIYNMPATNPERAHVPFGLTVPLTTSAFGRLSLAQMSERERQLMIRRINAELEPRRQISGLNDEIEKIRRDGYAATRSSEFEGWGMVAVTLPPADQFIYLGIGAPAEVIDRNETSFASALLSSLQQFQVFPHH